MTHPLFGKTAGAIWVLIALLAVPYATPRLARFRIARLPGDKEATVDQPESPTVATPVLTQGEQKLQASKNEATVTNALPEDDKRPALDPQVLAKTKGSIAITDPKGDALDAFYMQLARTKAKQAGAVTRIEHYGDSVITSDYVSGTMRRRLQAEFGDAGHGFLLVANPWEWYFHNDVSHGSGEGWSSSRITGPTVKDSFYGLGGVTFTGSPGASASFGTSDKTSKYGKNVSRFDIYYLETPNGGDVEVKLGGEPERFNTKGDEKVSKVKSFTVPDGEATMKMRVVSGNPRLFGVALERDQPGVVYDALGANGARSELLAQIDADHWKDQMDLRKPALIILQYGTNESEAPGVAKTYEKDLVALIEKVHGAAPNASILVASPLDRAEVAEGGGYRTKPIIKQLVKAQKAAAEKAGVAFFDTFEAMGGEGSMGTWVKKGLGGGDLTHPTPAGAEVIGDLFSKSLATGFEAWVSRHRAEAHDAGL